MSSAAQTTHGGSRTDADSGRELQRADEPSRVIRRDTLSPVANALAALDDTQNAPALPKAERLRAVLEMDRRDAGESRAPPLASALPTSRYATPLRVLWRRYYRANRSALIRGGALCLTAAVAVALCYGPLLKPSASRVKSAETLIWSADRALAAPRAASPTAAIAPALEAVNVPSAVQLRGVEGMSVRRRLVRADALLRHSSQRAAREARAILELTLPAVPDDAHGRAALAEACLRLGDEACARTAVSAALELRPRRSRYLALAREVERVFDARERTAERASATL